MSVRNVQGLSSTLKSLRKGYEDTPYILNPVNSWVRDRAWPSLTSPSPTSEIVTGLYAVWPEGANFFAVTFSGDYVVDQGDGTIVNVASGVQRDYEYDFNSANLYDATVTFNSSGNLVQRANHGYVNGDIVRFFRIISASNLTEGQYYYVINATTSSFQISADSGGSAISFSTNGSASLLPFKIATVSITPQSGQNLTSVNLFVKHSQSGLVSDYSTGWLDLEVSAPNSTSLSISSNSNAVRHRNLERINLLSIGPTITNFTGIFAFCSGLRSVNILANTQSITNTGVMFFNCLSLTHAPMFDTSNVISMIAMFQNCSCLEYVPLYNTALNTSFTSMFKECTSLVTVPEFDTRNAIGMSTMFEMSGGLSALAYVPKFITPKVTAINNIFSGCNSLTSAPFFETGLVQSMASMFQGCTSLESVPFYDTSSVTNMSGMFSGCRSLAKVPCFNTSLVTNMSAMFQNCSNLEEIPELSTALVTTMANMFENCGSIRSVPQLSTALVTTMASMFAGCSKLKSVPQLSTALVTTMASMFANCTSLKSVPFMVTSSVTNMSGMFSGCSSLVSVPLFNTASVTTMANMFSGCSSLVSVPLFNTASVTTMANMFQNCASMRSVPLFNTSLVTSMSNMFAACSSLRTIPAFNTTAVTTFANMFLNCSSLSAVPALAITTAVTSSAGLSNIFSTCNSNARIQAKNFRFTFSVANNKLSKVYLEELFTSLSTVTTSQTLTITGNYGIGTLTTKTANTTARSNTITLTNNTSGLSIGMIIHSGTGSGITTGMSATTDIVADTFTYTSHGLSNGTVVSFSAIGTTTGISTWTAYYVINSQTNTFQVSLTPGGSAIDLTGANSTVTARYANYITGINPNVSITLSSPCASSATNSSLSFRTLDTANALLRNWAIIF